MTDLSLLPSHVRSEIFRWQAALSPLIEDPSKPQLPYLRAVATRLRVSHKTAVRKFYAFRRDGLAGLVDRRALISLRNRKSRK
jgi:hypothetical protein